MDFCNKTFNCYKNNNTRKQMTLYHVCKPWPITHQGNQCQALPGCHTGLTNPHNAVSWLFPWCRWPKPKPQEGLNCRRQNSASNPRWPWTYSFHYVCSKSQTEHTWTLCILYLPQEVTEHVPGNKRGRANAFMIILMKRQPDNCCSLSNSKVPDLPSIFCPYVKNQWRWSVTLFQG